jgi:hypothetical protein
VKRHKDVIERFIVAVIYMQETCNMAECNSYQFKQGIAGTRVRLSGWGHALLCASAYATVRDSKHEPSVSL